MKVLLFVGSFLLFIGLSHSTCSVCTGCGNGRCEYPQENCATCPSDCGACPPCERLCGNGRCDLDEGETSCNCPEDCGRCCEDGVCRGDRGETFFNCPADCATTINGVVIDKVTRTPVVGVDVTCFSRDRSYGPLNTGLTNNFVFEEVPEDSYTCIAQDPTERYAMGFTNFTVSIVAEPQIVEIEMSFQYCSIVGVVYDNATDEAIDGADIQCFSNPYPPAEFTTQERCTSPMGLYFYVNVQPSTYECVAKKFGYADGKCSAPCDPGRNIECDVPMVPLPGSIFGKVLDSTTRKPVVGATIACTYINGNGGIEESNATGVGVELVHYEFNSPEHYVPAGLVTCVASGDPTKYQPDDNRGTVPRGLPLELDFYLDPLPAEIYGLVTDQNGNKIDDKDQPRVLCTYLQDGITRSKQDLANEFSAYTIDELKPNTYNCRCLAEHYTEEAFIAELEAGERFPKDCRLVPKPASLEVLSTSRLGNLPLTTVECTFGQGSPEQIVVTEEDPTSATSKFVGISSFGPYSCTSSQEGFLVAIVTGTLGPAVDAKTTATLVPNTVTVTVMDNTDVGINFQISATVKLTPLNAGTSGCPALQDSSSNTAPAYFEPICLDSYKIEVSKAAYEISDTEVVQVIEGQLVPVVIYISKKKLDYITWIVEDRIFYENTGTSGSSCPVQEKPTCPANLCLYNDPEAYKAAGVCPELYYSVVKYYWAEPSVPGRSDCKAGSNIPEKCLSASDYVDIFRDGPIASVKLVPDRVYYIVHTVPEFQESFGIPSATTNLTQAHFVFPNPTIPYHNVTKIPGLDSQLYGCLVDQNDVPITDTFINATVLNSQSVVGNVKIGNVYEKCKLENPSNYQTVCVSDSFKGPNCFQITKIPVQNFNNGYTVVFVNDETIDPTTNNAVLSVQRSTPVTARYKITRNTISKGFWGRVEQSLVTTNPQLPGVTVTCTHTTDSNVPVQVVQTNTSGIFLVADVKFGLWECDFFYDDLWSVSSGAIQITPNSELAEFNPQKLSAPSLEVGELILRDCLNNRVFVQGSGGGNNYGPAPGDADPPHSRTTSISCQLFFPDTNGVIEDFFTSDYVSHVTNIPSNYTGPAGGCGQPGYPSKPSNNDPNCQDYTRLCTTTAYPRDSIPLDGGFVYRLPTLDPSSDTTIFRAQCWSRGRYYGGYATPGGDSGTVIPLASEAGYLFPETAKAGTSATNLVLVDKTVFRATLEKSSYKTAWIPVLTHVVYFNKNFKYSDLVALSRPAGTAQQFQIPDINHRIYGFHRADGTEAPLNDPDLDTPRNPPTPATVSSCTA